MRRVVAATVIAAAVAAAFAGSAAAASDVSLVQMKGVRFPDRSFIVSLPETTQVQRPQISLSENGQGVSNLAVVPANSATRRSGVALVIDTSNSMRGAPIVNAMRAAQALADRRQAGQRIAVVTFNSEPQVVLAPTENQDDIRAALAQQPVLGEGTHFYDGMMSGLRVLQRSGITAGSIVLLSDGADTGSSATSDAAVAAARRLGTRIFTVGLASGAFEPAALRELSSKTGGTFAESKTAADLAPVFERLGYRLAHEFVVEYRSLAPPKERITVLVDVEGVGEASTTYTTPPLPKLPAAEYRTSAAATFWRSPATMVLAALLVALLLVWAVLLVVRPRDRAFRARVAEFVSVAPQTPAPERRSLPDAVFASTEGSFERMRWWARFKEEVAIAEISVPPVQIVLWTVVATFFVTWLLSLFVGALGLVGLGVAFLARMLVKRKLNKKRLEFEEQLPDNLQVLGSALRAGHSLVAALSVVISDAADPARREFQRVLADERLGVPLEDSLMEVARRMDCRDVEQVALVARISRETGANMAEVLDQVTNLIRGNFELRRLVKTLTAQGRMSNVILSALPLFLLVAIALVNWDYVAPLFSEQSGRIALTVAAVMSVIGSVVIRRIVNIKV